MPSIRIMQRATVYEGIMAALLCMAAGKRQKDKPSVQQAGWVFMKLLQRAEQQGGIGGGGTFPVHNLHDFTTGMQLQKEEMQCLLWHACWSEVWAIHLPYAYMM